MGGILVFDRISKSFGPVRAADGVSLEIGKGEFFSLLGPSGCGKTTLLRIVAGLERPDCGRVLLDGVDITELPPNRRRVNTIFQSYALFPHLSVWDNIAFGLEVAKRPRHEIETEVERMLRLIQMEEHSRKRPGQISGGQKQRVAVARALVNRPQVLLLDEPLAALDLKLRQRMLLELDRIHDEVGITFLYVTHDQGEAMSLSDRIAVMGDGRVEQVGTPAQIYEAPRSSFVAAFIGDTNFFAGRVAEVVDGDYSRLEVDAFPELVCFNDRQIGAGNRVSVSVRPEKIHISRERPAAAEHHNAVEGEVDDVIYLGSHTRFWVHSHGHRLAVIQQHSRVLLDQQPIRWQDRVWLHWHADDGFILDSSYETDGDPSGRAGDA